MNKIETTLIKMLKENTGSHMLDSGGAYGRNHERNQDKSFEDEPSVYGDADKCTTSDEINYTISVYHYLKDQLDTDEFSDKVNTLLNEIRSIDDGENVDYPHWCGECMDILNNTISFAEYAIENETDIVNTYNHESNLSQVIQYITFEVDTGDYYILLQIHGGCDVRGGYTDTVCFKIDNDIGLPCLLPEDVYGSIGNIQVDNNYNGYSLTDECGEIVEINEGDEIELYLLTA